MSMKEVRVTTPVLMKGAVSVCVKESMGEYLLQSVTEFAVDASVHAPERAVYLFLTGCHYLTDDHGM